jgi:UPF0716 protein FxsA
LQFPLSALAPLFLLAEIATFIAVGSVLGVLVTLALVLLATVAGVVLLRREGLAAVARLTKHAEADEAAARPLAEHAVVAIAALLLMAPGFLTDAAALVLLVPAIRRAFVRQASARFGRAAARSGFAGPAAPVVDLQPHEFRSEGRADSPWRRETRAGKDGGSVVPRNRAC